MAFYKVTKKQEGGGPSPSETLPASYLKWHITQTRSVPAGGYLQIAEFYVYINNTKYVWNNDVSITSTLNGNTGEGIDKLIDNNINTKYCTNEWGSSQTSVCDIVISLGETIQLSKSSEYSFVTANDETSRDPISWILYASQDGNNWEKIDSRNSETIPTGRKTETALFNMQDINSNIASNILKGATDPTSAVGSNGEIYLKYGGNPAYHYDEDLGGYCLNEYYVYDAGTYLATQSYEFRKTYDGGAISVYWHSNPWYGPILISTVADNIAHSHNLQPIGSAVIDGVTWYLSNDGGWSNAEDPNHAFPTLETNYTPDGANIENAIRAVLTASDYTSGQPSGTYITNSYFKKNNVWQNLIGSDVNDVLNITEPALVATGSFTTSSTMNGKVEIDCGFEPDYVEVIMEFSDGYTYANAYHESRGDNNHSYDYSRWDLRPIESKTYDIGLDDAATGETGICAFTSTGFKYRAHGSNTTNKACTYKAFKFQDGSTPKFDEDAFYQNGTWLHPEDMTMLVTGGSVDASGNLYFDSTTDICGVSTDDLIDEGKYKYVFFVRNMSSTTLTAQFGSCTPGYTTQQIIGTGQGRGGYSSASVASGDRGVFVYDINHAGGTSGVFAGMYPTNNPWQIEKILRIPLT